MYCTMFLTVLLCNLYNIISYTELYMKNCIEYRAIVYNAIVLRQYIVNNRNMYKKKQKYLKIMY